MKLHWHKGKSFSPNSTDGQRYFDEFKRDNPDVIFHSGDRSVPISEANTWWDVKNSLGITKGVNPVSSGVEITVDGTYRLFESFERKGRSPGVNAAYMELFAAIVACHPDFTLEEFLKDPKSFKIESIEDDDIDRIVQTMHHKDVEFIQKFFKVGNNIKARFANLNKYELVSKKDWNTVREHAAKLFKGAVNIDADGNRWNPADIVFVKDTDINFILEIDDINTLNEVFLKKVQQNKIIPISIKQEPGCIEGSKSIEGELKNFSERDLKRVSEIAATGKLEKSGIPVLIQTSGKYKKDTFNIKRRVLTWLDSLSRRDIEKFVQIAASKHAFCSVFYYVDSSKFKEYSKPGEESFRIEKITVPINAQKIQMHGSGFSVGVRAKRAGGGNISLNIEPEKRRTNHITYRAEFDNLLECLD